MNQKVELEKYNSPDALPRKMTVEKDNVRKLTDGELDNLAVNTIFLLNAIKSTNHPDRYGLVSPSSAPPFEGKVTSAKSCESIGIVKRAFWQRFILSASVFQRAFNGVVILVLFLFQRFVRTSKKPN